ncbi:hypothetical protein CGRA01v4_00811 [Colletotrichum graminicola]|nr:hypothetical protein CGRA01v4_00811 [Colletotrichum graminicola]
MDCQRPAARALARGVQGCGDQACGKISTVTKTVLSSLYGLSEEPRVISSQDSRVPLAVSCVRECVDLLHCMSREGCSRSRSVCEQSKKERPPINATRGEDGWLGGKREEAETGS